MAVAGHDATTASQEFENLAVIAGRYYQELFPNDSQQQMLDPRHVWYNALKERSGQFEWESTGKEIDENDQTIGYQYPGTIHNIAVASANLCLELYSTHPVIEQQSSLSGRFKKAFWLIMISFIGTLIWRFWDSIMAWWRGNPIIGN